VSKPLEQIAREFLDEFRGEIDNDESINGGDCVDKWVEYRQRFYDAIAEREQVQARFVHEVTVFDPDTGGAIEVEIYKDPQSGAMFGVDSTFTDQISDTIPSPFNAGTTLHLSEPPEAPEAAPESTLPKFEVVIVYKGQSTYIVHAADESDAYDTARERYDNGDTHGDLPASDYESVDSITVIPVRTLDKEKEEA
jgi:hypothetical protein